MKTKPKPTEWWHEHNLQRNHDAQAARRFRHKWHEFIAGFAQALRCDEAKAKELWERSTHAEPSFDRAMAIMGGRTAGCFYGAMLKHALDAGTITILSVDGKTAMDLSVEENGAMKQTERPATAEDHERAREKATQMARRAGDVQLNLAVEVTPL